MTACIVAERSDGCIVEVSSDLADRYLTGCPFWFIDLTGKVGDQIVFKRGNIVACCRTLAKAQCILQPSN